MRLNTTWIVVLTIAVSGIVSCLGISLLLFLSYAMGNRTEKAPPFDRTFVVSADDLATFLKLPGVPSLCEVTRTSAYPDGETRYSYKYESDRDPNASQIFSLDSATNVCPIQQMAVNVFDTHVSDAKLMVSLANKVTLRRRDDLLDIGDERFVAFFVNEFGETNGMSVAVRSGSTVVRFRMIGQVIQDPIQLKSILAPKLPK